MTCDKLVKEALAGIDFRYKMDDIINELPDNQKFSSTQLEGFLKKRGVSPKEIQANSIFTEVPPNKAYTAESWRRFNEARGKQHLTQRDLGQNHEKITLDKGSRGTDYKEIGDIIQQQLENNVPAPHYSDKLKPLEGSTRSEYLMGHRRIHLDTINGKATTVLNEFQSDWAQAQRAGRGIFKSNLVGDEVNPEVIADFPMSPTKYQQYQIVRTIDEAIKSGTNRIAIPIERGELMGTKGVTKFYDSLNKKLLPDIRKKLEKQGLRIKVDKEKYHSSVKYDTEEFYTSGDADLQRIGTNLDTVLDEFMEVSGITNPTEDSIEFYEYMAERFPDIMKKYKATPQNLHIIEIEEIPNKPVRWDIYSVLGSLGLSEVADKLKEEEN